MYNTILYTSIDILYNYYCPRDALWNIRFVISTLGHGPLDLPGCKVLIAKLRVNVRVQSIEYLKETLTISSIESVKALLLVSV